ncbi:hypothetical protein [Flagellimonas sp. S3867]|uniref:hypothetical protein n=1 Tax=Flagellimonas sp. S3867 TaxID=2768063 RepID=UPI0016870E6D|nr:hypothetical protein [Flagellimonas sp. S3867]
MRTILSRILFLFTLLFCLSISAQNKSYKEGYIIQHNGDTIKGFVKDRSAEPFVTLYTKIRFKQDGSSRVKKYDADDILGYGFGENHFLSIPFREEQEMWIIRYYSDLGAPRKFLKVIQQSEELVYYEQLFVHDNNFYLDSIPFFHRPNANQMVRVTQGILGFKKKRLLEYFPECPHMVQALSAKNSSTPDIVGLYEFYLEHCLQ